MWTLPVRTDPALQNLHDLVEGLLPTQGTLDLCSLSVGEIFNC